MQGFFFFSLVFVLFLGCTRPNDIDWRKVFGDEDSAATVDDHKPVPDEIQPDETVPNDVADEGIIDEMVENDPVLNEAEDAVTEEEPDSADTVEPEGDEPEPADDEDIVSYDEEEIEDDAWEADTFEGQVPDTVDVLPDPDTVDENIFDDWVPDTADVQPDIDHFVDTKTFQCAEKPAIGTEWNTVSQYEQTWTGSAWDPVDDPTTEYSTEASVAACRYKCASGYVWNESFCVQCLTDGNCLPGYVCNASNQCVLAVPAEACSTGTQSRDRCLNARVVGRSTAKTSSGYTISDNTCSAYNRVDQSSGCWDAGADHVYRIYLRASETAAMTLALDMACPFYDDFSWDATLAIYNDVGCASAAQSWCDDNFSGTTIYTAPADGWYYIVVDGATIFEDGGDYSFTVKLLDCVAADCNCP